jgi:peptidyl-prolyl cis-trans isomerase D
MRSNAIYIWLIVVGFFLFGFVFYQLSGIGSSQAGPTGVVATVNGRDITVTEWARATAQRDQARSQQLARPLSLDERQQLDQQTFDELVTNILIDQELEKRHIGVTDAEIIEAARTSPPPELMNAPQLQTEGKFDPDKYLRFLTSPMAKQQNILVSLESMYRTQIPREKLFEQIATGVFVTDGLLWRLWRDTHDTAQISLVRFVPDSAASAAVSISDADIRSYYNGHKEDLTRRGRAVVSLLIIPRTISHADSAATLTHLLALRQEIEHGAKFEDVAKRESVDSVSGADGGSLGWSKRGRFVPEFDKAAWALSPGQLSGPVLTQFGYHLIKMDEHKGDSALFRHVLLRIQASDSDAARTNAQADSLERLGAQSESPAQFDRAAATMHLTPVKLPVSEGSPVVSGGRIVPSVATWAFAGAKVGESSELFEADDAYYLARMDSLSPGGLPSLEQAGPGIRRTLARQRALDLLVPKADSFAKQAARTSLEAAAQAAKLTVSKSPPFTPTSSVPDIGQLNQVIGAAFAIPVGAISDAIKTDLNVSVLRVDRRVAADSGAWVKQKEAQRQNLLRDLRRQRVEDFLADLKDVAKITDNRKALEAAAKRTNVS